MSWTRLVLANLGRNPLRTVLTASAVALAVALVSLLLTMPAGLDLILDRLPGMRVIEAQVVRRPVETDDGYEYALDTLVRVRRPA